MLLGRLSKLASKKGNSVSGTQRLEVAPVEVSRHGGKETTAETEP